MARSSGSKKRQGGRRGGAESIVTISPSNNRTVCLPLAELRLARGKHWRRSEPPPPVGWYIIPAAKWVALALALVSSGRNNTDSFLAFRLESFVVRSALSAPLNEWSRARGPRRRAAPSPPTTNQILNTKLHYSRGGKLARPLARPLGSV